MFGEQNIKSTSIVKPRVNGRNIVGQQIPTLLDVASCVRFHTLLHVGESCYVLMRVNAQSLKPVKRTQQFPTMLGPLHGAYFELGITKLKLGDFKSAVHSHHLDSDLEVEKRSLH